MNKQIAVYDNTVSARTYLSYIAEQAGGFACIGRDGKLYIRIIGENTAELPLKYFQNFKWGEKFKISRVRYEDGVQLFENGDTTDNTVYINQDNMYIVDQEQIDNIYNEINGLEVYSFEGDSIIDPALDIGDILVIDNKKVIYQGSSKYAGKFKASISSKIQCKSKEETTARVPNQSTVNRRVQSQINQIDGTITLMAEETKQINELVDTISTNLSELKEDSDSISATVSETVARLNNDYLTAEQIEAENNTIKEGLETIKQQQASMELTSTGLQVQIDAINNEGVKAVKNTTVNIDEDGVTVGKSDSEFSATMSNTGTYMHSYNKQIAKYDKDGAEMYNLTVQNEAIIGNLRCLSVEVEGEKRTHIHWIGGW